MYACVHAGAPAHVLASVSDIAYLGAPPPNPFLPQAPFSSWGQVASGAFTRPATWDTVSLPVQHLIEALLQSDHQRRPRSEELFVHPWLLQPEDAGI
jgi:hypothetical protein